MDSYPRFHPEVKFDETGIRSSYSNGSSTFFAWNDIRKIELLLLKQARTRRGRFFLFWGPQDQTVLIPYEHAPLTAVQEAHWLPAFSTDKATRLPNTMKGPGDARVTFWERPSPKEDSAA